MTAEKIQKSVDKLISDGKLSIEEGKKLIDKLVSEGKLSTEEGKKVIEVMAIPPQRAPYFFSLLK